MTGENAGVWTKAYPAGTPNNNPWLDVIREAGAMFGLKQGACQFGTVVAIEETDKGAREVYPGARVDHWRGERLVVITAMTEAAAAELIEADRIVAGARGGAGA